MSEEKTQPSQEQESESSSDDQKQENQESEKKPDSLSQGYDENYFDSKFGDVSKTIESMADKVDRLEGLVARLINAKGVLTDDSVQQPVDLAEKFRVTFD